MDQYNFLFKENDVYEALTFFNKKHSEFAQELTAKSEAAFDEAQGKFHYQWDLEVPTTI